ncbi:MAG: SecD/SecF family protein translocase subunit, partial [Myxococcota bacterium]
LLVMLVYYRVSGAVGVVALVLNMIFLFAGLAIWGVTLTLPGIAGLALTIGMAVDANIIQFERIREELRAGKSVRAAVDAGFDKAFSAIFDANVTTFLACVVLGSFGSGPIRGFAVTLGIGVVINTFTAVVVPRLGLDYFTKGLRVKTLSI